MNAFRRSGVFGIVGVFVVAGAAAAIALTMGQGQANPKPALALIFGVIATFCLVLFLLQGSDLKRAEAADESAAGAPVSLENPALLDDAGLWVAMAVHPVGPDAVAARKETWATARASLGLARLITFLIFLAVPPVYLFGTFVPLFVIAPVIVLLALWKSARLLAAGGDLDQAYDAADRAMAPLGLRSTDRPTVTIEPKAVAPYRMGPTMRGALVLEGRRHGRAVTVTMPTGGVRARSLARVAVDTPEFGLAPGDGRPKQGRPKPPPAIVAAVKSVKASTRWNGVSVRGGDGAIEVERKSATRSDWLLDLWLAERLAAAVEA